MSRELEGKNAIITGASRGLGKALLQKLSEEGYNVWACAGTPNEEFDSFCTMLSAKHNVWIESLYFDLSSYEAIKDAYKQMTKKDKQIDVLINNAGIGHMNFLQMTKPSDIDKIYKINVLAPMYLSQLVIRNMQKVGNGNIINVSSTAATEVYEGNSIYGSTKAALSAFTKSLAAEVYRYGIRVNAIAPGLIDTDMAHIFEGKDPDEPVRRTALGRKIYPEEIAGIVADLLLNKYSVINGEVLCINGGHK